MRSSSSRRPRIRSRPSCPPTSSSTTTAAGEVYFAAVPVLTDDAVTSLLGSSLHTKVAAVDVGATKTIDVALFSDAPTGGDWEVSVIDAKAAAGQSPLLSLTLDKGTGSNGDTLHLTIKTLAAGP